MRVLAPVFVLLVFIAAGCGSSPSASSPATTPTTPTTTTQAPQARSAYATALATLCDRTRVRFEALGQPSEKPPAVLLPGKIRVARQFLRAVRALHPAPAEAARAQKLAARYALWYQGDRYALVAIKQNNQQAFFNLQEGADHWLAAAERVATSLGAPECSRRPFESP